MSDTSKSWGKEGLFIIGTQLLAIGAGALTLGVGYVAVNAAVWGTRGVRGLNYAYRIGKSAKTGNKLAQVGRWGAMSAIEGAAFHGGYETALSYIEGREANYTEHLWQSMAFAGAFRALKGIPGLNLNPSIPLSQQKLKIVGVLTVDTAVLGALGWGIDSTNYSDTGGIIFEPGEWTAENFIQAFAMAIMFRGMAHAGEKVSLRFRKDKDGKKVDVDINVNKHPLKENASFYHEGKNGTLYRIETDAKGWIKEVYNIDKKSPTRTIGDETKLNGGAKTAWIKNNIDDLYKNFGVKPIQADDLATGTGNVNTIENISNSLSGNILRKTDFIKSLLPKKGEEITIGNQAIKRTQEGKFQYNGKTYDKVDDILPILTRELTDAQVIATINSSSTKNLNKLFSGAANKEIQIGSETFRFRIEGGNKILEIKNGTGWSTKSIDEVTETQAQVLLDRLLGTSKIEKIIGSMKTKLDRINPEDVTPKHEKDIIIKRFGKAGWDHIVSEFKEIGKRVPGFNKSSNTNTNSYIYGPERYTGEGIGNLVKTAAFGSKGGTYTTMLGGIILNEGWEVYQAGGISERYDNYNIYTDGFDSIVNGILFKKVSLGRAIIYQTLWENTLGN